MKDRREFWKLSGAGYAIVPIIGGIPVAPAEDKIIESPKIEITQSLSSVQILKIGPSGKYSTTAILERKDGKGTFVHGQTFLISAHQEIKKLTDGYGISGAFSDVASGKRMRCRLEFEFVAEAKGQLLTIYEE